MNLPVKKSYTLYQGDTFRRSWTWQNADGSLYDLTGVTARMQVRPQDDGADALSTVTLDVDPATATLAVHLPAQDTAQYPEGVNYFDIELTFANGDIRKFITGKFKVKPEYTKA